MSKYTVIYQSPEAYRAALDEEAERIAADLGVERKPAPTPLAMPKKKRGAK